MNIEDNLLNAFKDQYGDEGEDYLHSIYLSVSLTTGMVYSNLYYISETEDAVLFHEHDGFNFYIKIIFKKEIVSIEPQYQTDDSEDEEDNITGYHV